MSRFVAFTVAVALSVLPAVAGARSLERKLADASELVGIASGSAFDALAASIADSAARSLPLVAASAGFTYRYNPTLEVFERTSETLGPLFLERPDTIGRGKVNVSVSFQYVEFNQYDGTDLTDLESNDPILVRLFDSNGNPIGTRAVRLRYSLGIQNYITAVSATYGVLDDLDVNLLVPIVVTNLRIGVHAQPGGVGHDDGTVTGVGDILLRGKYQLPRWEWLHSALGLQLRLPSGDASNFQGTGDVEVSPFLFLSTVLWDRLEPELNLGMDYRTGNLSQSAALYGIGADFDVTKTFNVNLAFLGRSELAGIAEDEDTLFLHQVGGQQELEPLLDLDFGRKDYLNLSFGLRWVVWRNVMLYANGIYALNDDGLRNDTIIPMGGVEGTF